MSYSKLLLQIIKKKKIVKVVCMMFFILTTGMLCLLIVTKHDNKLEELNYTDSLTVEQALQQFPNLSITDNSEENTPLYKNLINQNQLLATQSNSIRFQDNDAYVKSSTSLIDYRIEMYKLNEYKKNKKFISK